MKKKFKVTYCANWCKDKKPQFTTDVEAFTKEGAESYFANFYPCATLLKIKQVAVPRKELVTL